MKRLARLLCLAAALASLTSLACSNEKKAEKGATAIAAVASGLAARPAVPQAPSALPAPEKPVVKRPKDPADLLLDGARRKRLEDLAPTATGFLASSDLEQKLYAMSLVRGKDADALKAFDRLAKGKWVLFAGSIGAVTKDGFELPVRYAPQDLNDTMGVTAVWLPIRFSGIAGYDASAYRAGDLAVVLARYEGQGKASPGHDAVLLGRWFD